MGYRCRILDGVRRLSIVIACGLLCAFVSIMALSVTAWADDAPDDSSTVSRGEWLHQIVEAFDVTVEDENYPEEYFSDVTVESPYYLDFILAAEFGIIDVPAGGELRPDDPTTREFAAHTTNFCLGYQLEDESYTFSDADKCAYPDDDQVAVNREWLKLIDGAFDPERPITTAEGEKIVSDARTVWLSTQVESSHDNEVDVRPGVKVVPDDVEVKQLEENVISISDSPVELDVGDTFFVVVSGVPYTFSAIAVEMDGANTVVTTQNVGFDQAIEAIDYQSETAFNMTSVPESGGSGLGAQSVDDFKPGMEIKTSWTNDSVSASGTISTKGKDETGYTDETAKNEAKIEASVTNLKQQVGVSEEGAFFTITGDISVSASASGSMSFSVPLCQTPTYPVDFNISLDLSCQGSASAKSVNSFRAGFQVSGNGSVRTVKEFTRKSFEQTIEASMSLELKASANLNLIAFEGSIYAKAGVGADAKLTHYDEGLPTNCLSLAIYLKASVGVSANYSLGLFKGGVSFSHTFWHSGNSPVKLYKHIEDGTQVEKCMRGTDDYISALDGKTSQYFETSSNAVGVYSTPTWDYRPTSKTTATLTRYKGGASCVQIPSQIKDYKVTAVDKGTFTGTPVVSVTVPATITKADGRTFDSMKKIVFNADNTTITEYGLNLSGCSVTARGSLSCGSVSVSLFDGSSIETGGDLALRLKEMSGEGGSIIVHGKFSNYCDESKVTAGHLVFYGDVMTYGHFGSNALVTICGDSPQKIDAYRPSYYGYTVQFGHVEIKNPNVVLYSGAKIKLASDASVDGDLKLYELDTNGFDLNVTGNVDVMDLYVKDGSNVTIGGSLESARDHNYGYRTNITKCEASTITVKGPIVSTSSDGSIYLSKGSRLEAAGATLEGMSLNDSEFICHGNYGIKGSFGNISMTGESSVYIEGDARIHQLWGTDLRPNSVIHVAGSLTAASGFFFSGHASVDGGVLELEGDLLLGGYYSYRAGDGHMTVLCGNGPQSISFNNAYGCGISNVVNTHIDESEVSGIPSSAKYIHDPNYKTGDRYIAFARVDSPTFNTEIQTLQPRYGKQNLYEGVDYTVVEGDGEFYSAGTHTVTLDGIAPYKGTVTLSYYVNQADIANAELGDIPDVTFSGETFRPSPTAVFNGVALEAGQDYSVAYSNNRNAGTATVKLTGKGNYRGVKTVAFSILPNEAAQPVVDSIDRIGEVTIGSGDTIDAARTAYDGLSDFDKQAVPSSSYRTLVNAEASYLNLVKAQEIIDLIDGIGPVESLDSEPQIIQVRQGYNTLTNAQKKLVTNLAVLEEAEAAIFELSHVWADKWSSDENGHWLACSHCDGEKDAAGHVPGEPQVRDEVLPTCSAEGSYNLVTYCTVCDRELEREIVSVPPTDDHDWDDGEIVTAPTCGMEGVRVLTCKSNPLHKKTEAIPLADHDWGEWQAIAAATCTETGLERRVCSVDPSHYEERDIAALGHDYRETVIAPTEDTDGYTIHMCSRCGDAYVDTKVESLGKQRNAAAAGEASQAIAALPAPGSLALSDADAVAAARAAYEALTADQKALVGNVDDLRAAEARLIELASADKTAKDKAAADAAMDAIRAIPTVSTLTKQDTDEIAAAKAAVRAAHDVYDKLTADQLALVTNANRLFAAEQVLAALEEQAEADVEAAADVNKKIAAISTKGLTPADTEGIAAARKAVDTARAAYDKLTADQKALVEDAETLFLAEIAVANLEQSAKNATDTAAAQTADDVIAAIPAADALTGSDDDRAKVAAARAAYNALTVDQRALVARYDRLDAAEKALLRIDKEAGGSASDRAASAPVTAAIEALPASGEVSVDDAADITMARAAYDALTDAQRAIVSDEKLVLAETRLVELQRAQFNAAFEGAALSGPGYVARGGKATLALPEDAAGLGSWTWASSNDGVAIVDAPGIIRGVSEGTATVSATCQHAVYGGEIMSATLELTMDVYTTSLADAQVNVESQTYSGAALTPAPMVILGNTVLRAGTDYTVAYSSNVNAGTATVTVTGVNAYAGTASGTFGIAPANLAAAQVTGVENKVYSGTAQTQLMKVAVDGRTLFPGTDYDVSYANNVNVGTAVLTITGKGNYLGSIVRTFQITAAPAANEPETPATPAAPAAEESTAPIAKASIAGAKVTNVWNATYNGRAQTQKPTVTLGGKVLALNRDYKLSYRNNVKVGTATMTVTGIGAYSGTKSATFKVTVAANSLAKAKVTGAKKRTYNGTAQTQSPKVKLGKSTLRAGRDYTITYSRNVNAGTATATVRGIGAYSGTKTFTFKIAPAKLSKAKAGVAAQRYTGRPVTPSPVVKVGGKVLVKGRDYTVSYKNNVKKGTAKIVIKGKGNYTGSKTIKFKIK